MYWINNSVKHNYFTSCSNPLGFIKPFSCHHRQFRISYRSKCRNNYNYLYQFNWLSNNRYCYHKWITSNNRNFECLSWINNSVKHNRFPSCSNPLGFIKSFSCHHRQFRISYRSKRRNNHNYLYQFKWLSKKHFSHRQSIAIGYSPCNLI